MREALDIFIDGACRGNPGPAAVGVVITREGKTIAEISRCVGEATNNRAEYLAVIDALQEAIRLQAKRVRISTDSELVYRQLTGVYRIKDEQLRIYVDQVLHLKSGIEHLELRHVPREQNKRADRLANQALDNLTKKQAKMVAPAFSGSEPEPLRRGGKSELQRIMHPVNPGPLAAPLGGASEGGSEPQRRVAPDRPRDGFMISAYGGG